MPRRYGAAYGGKDYDGPANYQRPAGFTAHFDGFCWACDRQIVRGQSRVVKRGEDWVCLSCGLARSGDE